MCGLAGIVDLNARRAIDEAALARMTAALAHRGPDDEGAYIRPGVGIGHRRLAVIDPKGGRQPFLVGETALGWNGEIYNFEALGREIAAAGPPLATRSDTEVLARGLAHDGAEFINRLRGTFALAFWDEARETLLIARDRLGEKPLYYSKTADGFLIFASELPALAASGLVAKTIDPEAVADYFFYGYVPDSKTIYRGVFKLAAGDRLIVRRGDAPEVAAYWRPAFRPDAAISRPEAQEALRRRIDDAVSAQMVADAPLGVFLSGGVDSGAVAAATAKHAPDARACTLGFDNPAFDEREEARSLAERFGLSHIAAVAQPDACDLIDKIARAFGEPFADSSAVATYLIAGAARDHMTVALTGDGGDEVFAGYRRYPFFLREEAVRRVVPAPLRRAAFGAAGALYPKLDWAPRPLRAKTTFETLALDAPYAYARASAINWPARAAAMLSPDLWRALGEYDPAHIVARAMEEADTDNPLARAQYADMRTWLPGRMLTKIDRASMAFGLEARPPLLDIPLVEWANTLPRGFLLNAAGGKRILKDAVRPRLDEAALARPKRGFALPLAETFRRPDSPLARRLETARRWRESGLVDDRAVGRLLRDHRRGAVDAGQALWSILMFDAFLEASG